MLQSKEVESINLISLANTGHWPTIGIESIHRINMGGNLYFLPVTGCWRIFKIYVQDKLNYLACNSLSRFVPYKQFISKDMKAIVLV